MKFKKKKLVKIKKIVKKPKRILVAKKKVLKKINKTKPLVRFKANKNKIQKKKIIKRVIKKKRIKHTRVVFKKKPVKRLIKKPIFRRSLRQVKNKRIRVPTLAQESLAGSFFKAKIKVIGIGGGGGSIVSEIGRSLHKATFVVADTDTRAFKKRAGIKNFLFGQGLTHGLGTGVNPQLGRQAALSDKQKIAHLFDDQDIVIFIASLGGGLGSGATQVFAEAAKDFNGITLGIFTLPFKFEGKNKYKIAVKALRDLRKVLNVSITIPNERIFKIIQSDTAITDAFSTVNQNLIESLESLIDLIYSPGIINIDFADLRTILAGRGNLAFLNTMDASGKDKADQIAQNILRNPLYKNNNFTAEKILFNITGGSNLSMFEVDKISKAIAEQNKKAKIIFGISKDASYKNKIKATLLMTSQSAEAKQEDLKLKAEAQKAETVAAKPKEILKKKIVKNAIKKAGSVIKKIKKRKKAKKQKRLVIERLAPVFSDMSFVNRPAEIGLKKISIVESPINSNPLLSTNKEIGSLKTRKAIRRTALDIKKAEEQKENKQSLQEKEWEIPAFLRFKK